MNLVNGLATKVFDLVMWPLELLGFEVALMIISGVFGVIALVLFKHMSSQKGIAGAKDKIKGHMIEIRIYQDDLPVVGAAVGKILMRNFQYMGLNFLPFIPLSIPFVILLAQLVVRYGFEPLPVNESFTVAVQLEEAEAARVSDLVVETPDWLSEDELVIVRAPADGRAFLSIRDAQEGIWDFQFRIGSGESVTKQIVIGDAEGAPRYMQPDRVGSFFEAWLWPAEDTLGGSPFEKISIVGGYPMREYWWMPDGPFGLVIGVLVYSMVVGAAALKPLGVTI